MESRMGDSYYKALLKFLFFICFLSLGFLKKDSKAFPSMLIPLDKHFCPFLPHPTPLQRTLLTKQPILYAKFRIPIQNTALPKPIVRNTSSRQRTFIAPNTCSTRQRILDRTRFDSRCTDDNFFLP
jgi:hypothetical protein